MKTETIVYCVVALLLGMLLANMLKNVCGCKNVVEGMDLLLYKTSGACCNISGGCGFTGLECDHDATSACFMGTCK
jgi:hypothetical protein